MSSSKINILLIAGILLFWGMACIKVQTISAASKQAITIDQFISPETCGGCHSDIYDQWQSSMHNLSHKDPVYARVSTFFRKGLIQKGEIDEAESCVKCHTPVGEVSGFPKKISDDWTKVSEIAQQGIQCDYCHSVVKIEQVFNNGLVLQPGQGEDDPGTKYGPFKDSESDFHETAFSNLHTRAEFCGSCHDVKHVAFGTNIETTYTEWKNSPYNSKDPEKRLDCQGCHMYQRPGIPATGSTKRPLNPGAATDYSVERPHIFTHYFVGANAYIPGLFDGDTNAQMAIERLKNAAEIAIDTSCINDKELLIKITNSGAGHSIPTGVADLRQVWLEIIVKDKNNVPLFQTGILDDKGLLNLNAIRFHTVFGDGKGNPVVNIAKAKEIIKDNRIKAKQSVIQKVILPDALEKGMTISVRLLYRGMAKSLLNLIPGKPFDSFPVIEMAKTTQKI
jgi:hypothetical protein